MKADLIDDLSRDKIVEIVTRHLNLEVVRYDYLYDLYKGNQPILYKEEEENKPNNRIVTDFYGKLIDTEVGYFLGHPIVFNSEEENALDELGTILVDNEFDDLIMEIGKEMGIKGKSYMLIYQDEESNSKLCRLSPDNVAVVESKKGRGEIGVAIRYYQESVLKDNGEDEELITYIEIYDKNEIAYYRLHNGVLVEDKKRERHIYGAVPIIEFKNNEEGIGSFEKVITLVEAYAKLISDTSNEHEAYRNAYLVLKNLSADEETGKTFTKGGVIELFDDGEAYFLEKPILDSAINSHLDRLSSDIHKFSDIPDLSDEKFAGNLSGVAIRFKLLGLENKCIIKERKMTKAIRQMIRILNRVLDVKSGALLDVTTINIIFTRNVPNNLQEIVDSVIKLDGIVDKETLLALLPFIESPQEVIEKLREEEETYENDLKNYEDKMFNVVEDKIINGEDKEEEFINE